MALLLYSLLVQYGNGHSQISEHLKDSPIPGKGCEPWKHLHVSESTLLSLRSCVIQLHIDIVFEPMSFWAVLGTMLTPAAGHGCQ